MQWGTSKGIISWVLRVLHECFPLNVFMLHTSALAGRSVDNSRSIPRLLNTPSGVGTSNTFIGDNYSSHINNLVAW